MRFREGSMRGSICSPNEFATDEILVDFSREPNTLAAAVCSTSLKNGSESSGEQPGPIRVSSADLGPKRQGVHNESQELRAGR